MPSGLNLECLDVTGKQDETELLDSSPSKSKHGNLTAASKRMVSKQASFFTSLSVSYQLESII